MATNLLRWFIPLATQLRCHARQTDVRFSCRMKKVMLSKLPQRLTRLTIDDITRLRRAISDG